MYYVYEAKHSTWYTLCYFIRCGKYHVLFTVCNRAKVLLENGWNSKQMITEGEAAIPLETTLHAFRNQEKTKQRSTIVKIVFKTHQIRIGLFSRHFYVVKCSLF